MSTQNGFSAVELMISLFIAAIFLIAGHQLYAAVIDNSGEARQRAIASDIAERYLDQYTSSVATTCSSGTQLNGNVSPTPDNLVNAKVIVTTSCPMSDVNAITKVTATVSYDYRGTQEVTHARYASR